MADLRARLPSLLDPFTRLGERTAWPYLVLSLVAAVVIWAVRRRTDEDARVPLHRFVFPREVFAHRSALVDYRFLAVDIPLRAFLYLPIMTTAGALSRRVVTHAPGIGALGSALRHVPARAVLIGLVLFLLGDLALYLGHLAMHRIPALWALHEVHHSAEVLTPMTVHRTHPLEQLSDYVWLGVVGGIGTALWSQGASHPVGLPTILGVNALTVLFFSAAYQLRHSHIWLSYGPRLSRWFISPAQHQVHHSSAPQHWDRNMGFVFACWDRIFGTLYVPTEREDIVFGVAGADPDDYATVRKLYTLPVIKAVKRLPKVGSLRRRPAVTA